MRQFLFSLLFFCAHPGSAQDAVETRLSPLAVVSARYKDTYLKIVYSQPSKKGREVFGKLIPFGMVWSTGANETTEMTITRDIKVNGADLKAGTYSIFTIPGKTVWSIIFNSDLGLMGSYNYNAAMDVLRFEVPTTELSGIMFESFTIAIDQKNEKADISLIWDKTKVTLPIQFLEPKL